MFTKFQSLLIVQSSYYGSSIKNHTFVIDEVMVQLGARKYMACKPLEIVQWGWVTEKGISIDPVLYAYYDITGKQYDVVEINDFATHDAIKAYKKVLTGSPYTPLIGYNGEVTHF